MPFQAIAIVSLLSFPLAGYCQLDSLVGKWTNEELIFSSEKINDSTLFFAGGNLHEGGAAFAVRTGRKGTLILLSPKVGDSVYGDEPAAGHVGDMVKFQRINGLRANTSIRQRKK